MPSERSTDTYTGHADEAHPALTADPAPPFDVKKFRQTKRESQEKFWSRFGVTQSSGSRFETGMVIPAPVGLLLRLYVNGTLGDSDLIE